MLSIDDDIPQSINRSIDLHRCGHLLKISIVDAKKWRTAACRSKRNNLRMISAHNHKLRCRDSLDTLSFSAKRSFLLFLDPRQHRRGPSTSAPKSEPARNCLALGL